MISRLGLGAFVCGLFALHCGVKGNIGFVPEEAGADDGGSDPDGFVDPNTGFLRVTPNVASVEIDDGNVANKSVVFTAEQKQADGTWTPTNACDWSLGNVDMGSLAAGTFQPSGSSGGVTDVTCTIGTVQASATLSIVLKDTLDENSGLDGTSKTNLLGSNTPDPSVQSLLYPSDKTVFPRGLAASPELMWNSPNAQDAYAAIYESKYATVTQFFTGASPGRHSLSLDEWNKLGASNPDGKVTVTLRRFSGGNAYVGPKETWTLSRASLKGTVYFWQVVSQLDGDVVKMPFGKAPAKFLQSGGQCTGCHAVSRDGSTIAAGTSGNGSNSAYAVSSGMKYFQSSGWSGYRDIVKDGSIEAFVPVTASDNYHGQPVALADTKTGQTIPNTGLESIGLTSTPTFSGDSKLMAFSVRNQPNASDQQHNIFWDSDLALVDFDLKNRKATNFRTLVKSQNQETLVFPSFTPDGQRVAFQAGNQVRARNAIDPNWAWTATPSKGDLSIVDVGGTNRIVLAAANGTEQHNFHPIFSPVVQGGYFWVVFTGLRTYGNRLTNTGDFDYGHCVNDNWSDCRSRQLWVAAIDAQGKPATDPSHPAFWLPGQDLGKQNFDAYWSLDACKANGSTCEAGFECCEGTCRSDNGKKTCSMRMGCASDGDTCTVNADCCGGGACLGGVCSLPAPP